MVGRRGNEIFNSAGRVAVKILSEICANFHIAPKRRYHAHHRAKGLHHGDYVAPK
ncbi:Uncharacterised protein [Salmonella enterica]|nr:Uncharacterised protein [Salmonella enterica]